MSRVHNFSAGPAALPEAVLQQIKDDIPDWAGTGMSVMEVSHRGKDFVAMSQRADQDIRELLDVPDDYSVLYLQGGATLQFAMTVLNLSAPGDTADYVVTGSWGKKAAAEAGRFCNVNIAADAENSRYTHIPPEAEWRKTSNAAFLHYTPNETIGGVEFHFVPETGSVPLVADMSSTILSRPIDVRKFGVIYAGAQKNIGPAGITVVIVRNDLLDRARANTPTMLTYKAFAASDSMTNTPPAFPWYVAGLVFKHLKELGGLPAIAKINERKAKKLYAVIDSSDFYSNPVQPDCRSWMNVPFILAQPELDATFLEKSTAAGLTNLKGHRSVGGMRASIYNAVCEASVDALIDFMRDFERTHA
jgi:phosphoserine aminotransferase